MPFRYVNRKQIEIKSLDSISVYSTPRFRRITDQILQDLEYESYVWSRGDRFYKLAKDFYGDVNYWWVIALFNNAPTEQHILIGEEIFIPSDLESVANILEVV